MTEIPAATRQLIYLRDNRQCVACGTALTGTWHSIQHRVARGTGGTNSPANLVLLCGSATSPGCHRRCEDRDPAMHARGYWLNSWEDPAVTPVERHDGIWVTLNPGGTWTVSDRPA